MSVIRDRFGSSEKSCAHILFFLLFLGISRKRVCIGVEEEGCHGRTDRRTDARFASFDFQHWDMP
jgi:hypothetical protein